MKTLKIVVAAATLLACAPAFAQRLADVSVYDRSEGRWLQAYRHEGRTYVVGEPGHEYQIRVTNRLREDLLAVVSVDGVNVLSGQTAHTQQGGYVISPWQRQDIRGWRKSLDEIASFYFTHLGDSYAARTGRPDNVGVIGVALFRRKAPPPPVAVAPMEESRDQESRREKATADSAAPSVGNAQRSQAPSAPLGTGHGRREESRAQWTAFERASEHPVETITIYYDSHRNLVARGVLAAPIAPRDPRPFPGFVPDPA